MGIVLSITALTQKIQSKLQSRKQSKSKPTPTLERPAPFSTTQPNASVDTLQVGLASEHLAASSPPILAAPTGHTREAEEKGQGKGTTAERKMASDEEYTKFLERANQDPNEGVAGSESVKKEGGFKALDKGVVVPTVLKKAVVDAFYTSDADEPFEVVGLRFEGSKLPDEATFAKTIDHPNPKDASVTISDVAEWDVNGEYKELVDAVREAVKGGDVRVYRVERVKGGSRVEYWVLGVEGGKLVGVKALGVES